MQLVMVEGEEEQLIRGKGKLKWRVVTVEMLLETKVPSNKQIHLALHYPLLRNCTTRPFQRTNGLPNSAELISPERQVLCGIRLPPIQAMCISGCAFLCLHGLFYQQPAQGRVLCLLLTRSRIG